MRIRQLPNDVMVIKVDNTLFRGKGHEEWLIGLEYKQKDKLKNAEKSERQSLKFSNVPMIACSRIYNVSEPIVENNYKQAKFLLKDLSNPTNSNNNCFEYVSNINYQYKTIRQVKVKIPKLEMARVLFFHNSYLAVSSIQERVLDLEFKCRQENGKNIISVLPHCSLCKTQFEDMSFRSKLSWLLLNTEIKSSYYSIYKNLVENKTNSGRFDRWIFDFTPPRLYNLTLIAKGYLKENEVFYVDEIVSIKGIVSGIEGEVVFEGDGFTQEVTMQGSKEIANGTNHLNETVISDDYEPNSDAHLKMIETPQVLFDFQNPIVSTIKRNKIVKKFGSKLEFQDAENQQCEIKHTIVATDEAIISGKVPKGEFQTTDDITNRETQYRQMFSGLIAILENMHLGSFMIHYPELPKIPRCKLDRKLDGNKRVLLKAEFTYKNHNFMILELDTTDLQNKRLSTLIINNSNEIINFDKVLISIVKTSLSWKKLNFFQKINLTHPKDFYIGSDDSEGMLQSWAERIENALNELIYEQ